MKNNKWNLVCAILYMSASICFILAATFNTVALAKGPFFVAGLCMLIGSIGFFSSYVKNKKSDKHKQRRRVSGINYDL